MQNDDVVLIRDRDGRRYQYPMSEVSDIQQDSTILQDTVVVDETPVNTTGKVALRLDMAGGGVFVPAMTNGGGGAVDLQIGTRNLANRRVFVGGGVGYMFARTDRSCHFIPLTAVFSMPLMEGRHAPELGAALGYAFAVKQPDGGGMMAKLDFSWRYQYSESSALLVGVQVRFQQAKMQYEEQVNDNTYSSTLGKNIVLVGLRLALVF